MSRPVRIEFNDAWYHVMNRGCGRRPVFKTDDQRDYFLLFAHTHERFNADWHAYCLMENHYHLMVHTPESNLQRIMRHINGVHTQYYNRSERTDGTLFRGRYKAILVDADASFVERGVDNDLADFYSGKRQAPILGDTAFRNQVLKGSSHHRSA